MANFAYNVSKGRIAEFVQRVNNNDPATCALVVVAIQATGELAQGTQEDLTTLAAVLAGGTLEATNVGYSRKALVAADIGAFNHAPDNAANTNWCDLPDITWTGVAAAGGAWGSIIICYRPATASADTLVVPMTHHTFAVTPDGSDITAQIAAGGFYSAA